MPTKKREWYPGASYHITVRGNHRNVSMATLGECDLCGKIIICPLKLLVYENSELIVSFIFSLRDN